MICYVKTLEIPVGYTGHWQRVKDWEWMLIELTKERRPVESTEQQRDTIYYINMSHGQTHSENLAFEPYKHIKGKS